MAPRRPEDRLVGGRAGGRPAAGGRRTRHVQVAHGGVDGAGQRLALVLVHHAALVHVVGEGALLAQHRHGGAVRLQDTRKGQNLSSQSGQERVLT